MLLVGCLVGRLTHRGVRADAEDGGGEEEAEEDHEEGVQELQEAFLGEASVPLSAAQVQESKVSYVTGSFPPHHCRATDATSKAIISPVYPWGWRLLPWVALKACSQEVEW